MEPGSGETKRFLVLSPLRGGSSNTLFPDPADGGSLRELDCEGYRTTRVGNSHGAGEGVAMTDTYHIYIYKRYIFYILYSEVFI